MALCVGIMNVIEDAPLGPPVDLRAAQAAPCYEQAMSDGGSASVPLFYASASMSAREASELEGCAEEDARDESNDDVQVSRSFSNLSTASHITGWHERDETMVILDWDDTLCPTTWIRSDPRLQWSELAPCFSHEPEMPLRLVVADNQQRAEMDDGSDSTVSPLPGAIRTTMSMKEALEQHVQTVVALLKLASELGHVKLVTLAKPAWLESSIANFLPGLVGVLQHFDVEIVYARDSMPERDQFRAANDDRDVGQVLKTKAISGVVKRFYNSGRRTRSWKNILSIGDSECEKYAVQDVVFRHSQKDHAGHEKRCRCKAVKMLERPDLLFLTGQLQAIISWLAKIAYYDGDMDIDLDDLLEPNSPTSPLKSFCQPPPDLALS
mmetsp:Transcript_20342/g.38503  ORF Transcript_20342/g.38503 Transcript_20342/m.38503 type:complete len:381 (+) Transcript_20342:74-1216(+)